jgi:hypothetical protein
MEANAAAAPGVIAPIELELVVEAAMLVEGG